jgi:hypothetical protein
MEYCNAFLGKADRPSDDEVITALGPTAELWNEFIAWIAKEEAFPGRSGKASTCHNVRPVHSQVLPVRTAGRRTRVGNPHRSSASGAEGNDLPT